MRLISFSLMLALALPVAGQDTNAKKPAPKRQPHVSAHTKPTPQQIRKFNELEKKEQTGSGGSQPKKVRAPSPK